MSRQRFVQLLIAAVIAVSIALLLNARRNETVETPGLPILPGLSSELNSVNAVSLRKAGATPSVTLRRNGEMWTVAERADYPADLGKLRKLLLSLGDSKIIEEKTSDPQRFADIGVDEPAAGTTGVEVTVTTPKDKFALIVGKPLGGGNFVRKPDGTKSYSVEPGISVEADPHYWIDASLLAIQRAQIQAVEVKVAGSPAYTIHRTKSAETAVKPGETPAKPGDAAKQSKAASEPAGGTAAAAASPPAPKEDTFTLDGVPAGRKALESPALSAALDSLSALNTEDVAPAGGIDFAQASQATVTLADGSLITLTGVVAGDKHWIQIAYPKDAKLTAKTAGRAFEIASYRYDGIFKPLDQWLVPKESPAAAKEPSVIKRPTATRQPKGLASPATP